MEAYGDFSWLGYGKGSRRPGPRASVHRGTPQVRGDRTRRGARRPSGDILRRGVVPVSLTALDARRPAPALFVRGPGARVPFVVSGSARFRTRTQSRRVAERAASFRAMGGPS